MRVSVGDVESGIVNCMAAVAIRVGIRETRSPAFQDYQVRGRGQLVDRRDLWRAFANRRPYECLRLRWPQLVT